MKQKNFECVGALVGSATPHCAKVFWFFSNKEQSSESRSPAAKTI
jgi:hypothetical protein